MTKDTSVIRPKRRIDLTLICMVLLIVAGFIMVHDILNESLFRVPAWDSYTMQAMAWRDGRAYLDKNYSHLELAVYKGHYFVSFPPFPSVLMYPLTFIFGDQIPTNFIMMLYSVALAVTVYLLLKKLDVPETRAAFLSVFYVFGSNLASISLNGSVWWHAQMLCVLLCTLALYSAVCNKRIAAYALVALSVGCRPFTILFFILLFVLFYRDDKRKYPNASFWSLILKQLPCLIIPALIGSAYMYYNFIRFDNPLEFGHNYLPEFTESTYGQFNLIYLPENLYNLFIRPVTLKPTGGLEFTMFDGFMFYIANPIFLIVIIRAIIDAFKRRFGIMHAITLFTMLLYIILLSCHKTLGGWQFGARYTVDIIPMALLYLILAPRQHRSPMNETHSNPVPKVQAHQPHNAIASSDTQILNIDKNYTAWSPSIAERAICIFGIMFNIYGAVYFWVDYMYMLKW